MKILLANPRGFCAGVNMAIESLDKALEIFGPPIYAYHEIVHNQPVVQRFRAKGVIFVDSIEDVPEGATVLYSAHGVAPAIREASARRNLRAIDATCPLVTKVHLEAIRFANEGYRIILIGHEGHEEIEGTMGEAPHSITLVESIEDVHRLKFAPDAKLAWLTQTTLSVDEAEVIVSALKKRYPQVVGPNKDDICYATQNRQEAIKELVPQVDIVLVLGSQNSSNSLRLTEIAWALGRQAYLIDGASELKDEWFVDVNSILVTAGASAPEDVVQECIAYLQSKFGASVESKTVREEHISFPLPKELRTLPLVTA